MTPVVVGLLGVALLIALAAAVLWQERSQLPRRSIVYSVEDSIPFVRSRLSGEAAASLRDGDVRRILEWSVRYLQDPEMRAGPAGPPVAGSPAAARYVGERSMESGFSYDGGLILEVLRAQNEYLAALGALGDAVEERERVDGDEPRTR